MMPAPFVLAIRVKPGAGRTRIGGRHDGSFGPALVVAVAAPAVNGRATEAAIRAVAAALDLPAARITLRTGATSRDKLLSIADPPADLPERVARLHTA
jgi:uncharacterized protein YggU (UPF0235/DUF167 family)